MHSVFWQGLSLASIPVATAFIGWLTNWVAIRMLFRPRRPIRILGYTWQGLLVKRQNELASIMGEIIEKELINGQLIGAELKKMNLAGTLEIHLQRLITEKLSTKLSSIPIVGALLKSSAGESLEKFVFDALRGEIDLLSEKIIMEVEGRFHIGKWVEEKMALFEIQKLESIIVKIAHKEPVAIEWLGGVLGFIVGLIQLAWFFWVGQLK